MFRMRFPCLLVAAFALFACSESESEEGNLLLVTTTSVRDSGLLYELLPHLEERLDIRPQIVAVGSGAALRMGRDGNADVLLTHAPHGEKELLASGAVVPRTPVLDN